MSRVAEKPLAFVSGAHQGIGNMTARHLAARGAAVVCADLQDCTDTVAAIERDGGEAIAVALDVRSSSGWDAAHSAAVEWRGTVNWLANVAGVGTGIGTALEVSEEEWDRTMEVNAKGTWLGIRTMLPGMLEARYGRICNVSTVVAFRGTPGLCAYTASKGAVTAMTRQIAVDYAGSGVRVNAVAPGVIDTPILGNITDEERDELSKNHLLERLGTPVDVARVIAFLCSEESDFITAQVLPVDGGWSGGP
jgi:NAD(P)-dependent dehydrogenase (short-subunit alcohol dehydrogenase family)